jgi:hypothetical protein
MAGRVTLLGLVVALQPGCGAAARIPTPRYGEHPVRQTRWQEVETPPPAIEIEEPGPAPAGRVWVDGQWLYQPLTRRWIWEQGQWCAPPAGMIFYAPATIRRERRTTLDAEGNPRLVRRWSDYAQKEEEVVGFSDHWSWSPGAFYVAAPDGSPQRWTGALTCSGPVPTP